MTGRRDARTLGARWEGERLSAVPAGEDGGPDGRVSPTALPARAGAPLATVLFVVALWASSFPGIKAALAGYAPLDLAVCRFWVASLALGCAAATGRVRRPRARDAPAIAALSAIGVAGYHVLLNTGELHAPASVAAFLTNLAPLFTALAARVLWAEPIGVGRALGAVCGLFGVWLIAGAPPAAALARDPGVLLLLLAALCWSGFFLLQKPLLRRYSYLEVTCYAVWSGTLLLQLAAPGALLRIAEPPWRSIACMVYLGLGPTALAYVAWSAVLARTSAAQAALYTYLVPVVSAGLSFVWLGERPDSRFAAGAAAILAALALSSGPWGSTARRPRPLRGAS
jgi:drug/metabolite transporter (DMT)-like permease